MKAEMESKNDVSHFFGACGDHSTACLTLCLTYVTVDAKQRIIVAV